MHIYDREPPVRTPKRLRRVHNGVTEARELYGDMKNHGDWKRTSAPRKHSLRDHRKGR